MSLARIQNFSISLDGFGTGEGVSRDAPFGHAGERLHPWMFATRWWKQDLQGGSSGGGGGVDDAFARQFEVGIGAEIMGAGKFGFPGWHEDPDWKGWWGPNPPFHTPVFVVTHEKRAPWERPGGTTFHFVNDGIESALGRAREAAGGRDVRIAGGGATILEYLNAGLIDEFSIALSPVLFGAGIRLFEGVDASRVALEPVRSEPTQRATPRGGP